MAQSKFTLDKYMKLKDALGVIGLLHDDSVCAKVADYDVDAISCFN
jgi:hypothetical protein